MQRTGDLAATTMITMSAVAPTPPQHRPATRSAKRQLEQQDAASNPLPSKRARRSIDAGIDASERLLPRCRGGGTHRKRVVEDTEDDEQSPATPEKEPAAQANERHDESKDTTSSQKPAEDTTGGNEDENSSGPTSSSRKSVDNTDGSTKDTPESKESTEEVTNDSSSQDAASTTPATAESNNNNSSSPDETTESATSPEVANKSGSDTEITPQAPTTSANEDISNLEASSEASTKSTRLTEVQLHNISGLVNNNQQCFANSVIQLVDAALDDHDVDMVLGKNGSTAPFSEPNLTPDDQESLPEPTRRSKGKKNEKKRESKVTMIKSAIHDRIQKVRTEGKLKALSLRGHLRALINRMRQHKGKGSSKLVTPIVFQQVLAYGDEEADLEHLDGRQQQDCYEYLQAMVNGLKNDTSRDTSVEESVEKSEIINSMFETKTATRTLCSNESCDFQSENSISDTQNAHTVYLARMGGKKNSKTKKSAMDLMEESNVSEMDVECAKCGKGQLRRVTTLTKVADNFVLHILRAEDNSNRKIKTPVELPLRPIDLCGKQFVLNAVIKHKGDTTSHGHYTIFRRRTRHWVTATKSLWYEINDSDISPVDTTAVQDHNRKGQSTMLLFKAL
jgi:ubiquitin C-terminal hydrolase